MQQITTHDLYEACYYLLNNCSILAVEGQEVNGKIACLISFEGEAIEKLQLEYYQSTAVVNLFEFRRAYSQISSFIYNAKKKLKDEKSSNNNNRGNDL